MSMAADADDPLHLRPTRELARVPPESSAPPSAQPRSAREGTSGGASWVLTGVAALAALGWVVERRRRRLLETEKDSVLWAHVQPPGSSIVTTAGGLTDILPDSPNPAEAARAIYVTAIGETISRREATLIDLHQLNSKLNRRRKRGDIVAAVLLLQEHLVAFRYTSPWVFLELLDLYRQLGRQAEWEIARKAFGQRFGQNAPAWDTPSTEHWELLADRHLSQELAAQWPYREARMFMVRWMLGEHEMRQKCSGPPLLGLGVYRDLMLLDGVLDFAMEEHTVQADSLL